ncbi:hypothetical protein LPJ53_002158 [Coemansia erecta]|uniref:Uncharacterized protein n=1 Tax=Coemansia erecta TaxID=147472 RepID=A0A9W7Y1Y0_9FUNG|nr:hypothetical protein LPJ53_002158 [Coemansia erecta]
MPPENRENAALLRKIDGMQAQIDELTAQLAMKTRQLDDIRRIIDTPGLRCGAGDDQSPVGLAIDSGWKGIATPRYSAQSLDGIQERPSMASNANLEPLGRRQSIKWEADDEDSIWLFPKDNFDDGNNDDDKNGHGEYPTSKKGQDSGWLVYDSATLDTACGTLDQSELPTMPSSVNQITGASPLPSSSDKVIAWRGENDESTGWDDLNQDKMSGYSPVELTLYFKSGNHLKQASDMQRVLVWKPVPQAVLFYYLITTVLRPLEHTQAATVCGLWRDEFKTTPLGIPTVLDAEGHGWTEWSDMAELWKSACDWLSQIAQDVIRFGKAYVINMSSKSGWSSMDANLCANAHKLPADNDHAYSKVFGLLQTELVDLIKISPILLSSIWVTSQIDILIDAL